MNTQYRLFSMLIFLIFWSGHMPLHARCANDIPVVANPVVLLPQAPDNSGQVIIDTIRFEGNRRTRVHTIMRELLYSTGDTLSSSGLTSKTTESRSNLLNTGLFNFVEVSVDTTGHSRLALTYSFVERWNIWPIPVLELDEPNLNQWLDNPSFSRLNYGVNLLVINMAGRNERIRLEAKAGNVQSLDLALQSPYLGKSQRLRWKLHYRMNRTKRQAYNTVDNEQVFARLENAYIASEYLFRNSLQYRPGFYSTHTVSFGYHYHDYADTLLVLNPRFGPNGENRFSFLSLGYTYRHDRRDIVSYPLDGFFFEAGVTKQGLPLAGEATMDVTTLRGTIKHYRPLASKWYTAWSITGKWSEGTTLSYFDQKGLGFNRSLVRGYEEYVVDGYKYVVGKSSLKYNLLPRRVSTIGFIPTEKFSLIHYALYLNLFVDVGMISDRHFTEGNSLANKWLAGTGVGLDFHTYYDKVFRGEITINRHGNAGVFFHLTAPI